MLRDLRQLYSVFFRIGLFSIGGGYVMLTMLREELVEKYGWLTDEEILNYYAIGQATPGIIAINTATFVGYKHRGVAGAFTATAGMVTPSLSIISLIAMFFSRFQEYALVQQAFQGIRVAVVMLLVFTLIELAKKSVKDRLGILLALGAFCLVAFAGLSPIPIIFAAAIAGLLSGHCQRGQGFFSRKKAQKSTKN